jgi:hypothetical protein
MFTLFNYYLGQINFFNYSSRAFFYINRKKPFLISFILLIYIQKLNLDLL